MPLAAVFCGECQLLSAQLEMCTASGNLLVTASGNRRSSLITRVRSMLKSNIICTAKEILSLPYGLLLQKAFLAASDQGLHCLHLGKEFL